MKNNRELTRKCVKILFKTSSTVYYRAISQALTLRPLLGIQPMPRCGSDDW